MQQTKTRAKKRAAKPNGSGKSAPDLMGELSKAQRKAQEKALTADEIADCIETHAKQLLTIAENMRNKA